MSNSPLVTYTKLTKNKSTRKNKIDTITIHCYVGQVTAKKGCDYFANTDREVSSNYVIGYDGSIGLSVEEKYRAWTTGGTISVNGISGSMNDHRAVTIEVASDSKKPYKITDKAYKALVNLVADICKRNDIKELKWKGDKSLVGNIEQQNMTAHRWFAKKSCPGDYIYSRLGKIASEVNAKLKGSPTAKPELYRVRKEWKDAASQKGAFAVLSSAKSCAAKFPGYSVFNIEGECVYTSNKTIKPYRVQTTTADLNIRRGPGTMYAKTGRTTGKGVFTIIEESAGPGSNSGWGKLKSGAGWISLDYVKKI